MLKQFTIHRTVFLHAAWLDQISIHCPIFLTAASRRSLDRVSVPVWGTFLSDPLAIVALVGRYPANWLMSREPIRNLRRFHSKQMPVPNLWRFTPRFHGLSACYGHVAHALRTLAPVADKSIATLSLPLDLHVLSLPLAFILSQDQTLHCTSFFVFFKYYPDLFFLKRNLRSNVFRVALYISYFLSSMLLVSIIISINCRSVTSPWRLPKRAANIGQNFYCTKTYFKYFLDYLLCD